MCSQKSSGQMHLPPLKGKYQEESNNSLPVITGLNSLDDAHGRKSSSKRQMSLHDILHSLDNIDNGFYFSL